MNKNTKIIIEGQEGNLDYNILKKIIEKINLDNIIPEKNINAKNSFSEVFDYLKTIKKERHTFDTLLVIVDLDEDKIENRFKKLKSIFDSKEFNLPQKVGEINNLKNTKKNLGIFLLPNNEDKGSMDTLAFETLNKSADKYLGCLEEYKQCVENKGVKFETQNQLDKFKVRSIMAALCAKGDKRQYKFIDFEHKKFEALKKFLLQLSKK